MDHPWVIALFTMLLTAFAAVASVLGLYFYRFNGDLAQGSGEWNNFGSFIGGTLGPLLAFFSFIALVVTLHLQRIESRNATQALFRIVELLHRELEQIFLRPVDFSPTKDLMGTYFSASARSKDEHHMPRNGDPLSASDRTCILDLFERISELDGYLSQYESNFGHGAATYYFRRRYMTARRKLVDNGFALDQMWLGFKAPWAATVGGRD